MRTSFLGLALLAACDGGTLTIVDEGGGVADTDAGSPTDTDVDTDTVVDTDVDTDGGGPTDTDQGGGGGGGNNGTTGGPLDPFTEGSLHWTGQRHFAYTYPANQSCSLNVAETGPQIGGGDYQGVQRACAGCQRIFEIALEPDGWCAPGGFVETTYRGLKFLGGGQVEIYTVAQYGPSWQADLLATGTVDDHEVTYQYRDGGFGYSYKVTGTATLE